MGVPRFFKGLQLKYKGKFIAVKKDVNNINSLCFDLNCAIHPQCFKILAQNPNFKNNDYLEKLMIDECIKYLQFIIEYINPENEIYIAIDGVAPVAKIKQQRQRRFKSIKDRVLYNNIKKKHKKEILKHWNNSAISPGTPFMKKLTNKIIEFCKTYETKVKIYFSSAYTPGEGEHKILQHIRNSDKDYKYVIYGLDADLIFLALSSNKDNIYLLRESQEIKSKNNDIFSFVNIDILKHCIFNEINSNLNSEFIERNLDKNRVINDFIFICYFLGNDFLPHIPSIDISCFDKRNINGLDILMQGYCHTFDNLEDYLISLDDSIVYNVLFLQTFLDYLSTFEDGFFKVLYETKKRSYKISSDDAYEIEMHKIDNLQFKIENPINLGKDDADSYKFRYYKEYFSSEYCQNEIVKDACNDYFKGLLWVANYYFKKCNSWNWYYLYDHAPFISDLADNFKRINLNEMTFELGKPLNQIEQLACILPPQSSYLAPQELKWYFNNCNSPLSHLYPINYELDLLYKDKYWQAIPKLPSLDIDLVKRVLKKFSNNNILEDIKEFN